MKNEKAGKLVFLTLIVGRKQKDEILTAMFESGAKLISTLYGRGAVSASFLKNLLGLVPEENKAVITCLITEDKVDATMQMLIEKFNFNKPNTGIAFTIPVSKLSV
ncbi:MAG: hypothetical protein PHY15_10180 [Eubacteriales bacterium]|nr:hypothetical protein [Eubacteriales bacterium]MDD4474843.1 hypothetical protein [Eubacteriales bacterium]